MLKISTQNELINFQIIKMKSNLIFYLYNTLIPLEIFNLFIEMLMTCFPINLI